MLNQVSKKLFWALIALTIFVPISARADAGTPLMWAGMLHLIFGNAIIGIFEGLILAWVFKLRKALCILVMIPANYFSAWVGGLFLDHEITTALPLNLYNAWHWIWIMVVVTFLLTLILEWPFVFYCFRKERDRFKRSWQGNLLVNSLSYALLFGWYWLASGTTLYTKMDIVQPSEISLPKEGFVYFISKANGVCKLDLSSSQTQTISPLKADLDDRLFVRRSTSSSDSWELLDSTKQALICSNLLGIAFQGRGDSNEIIQLGTSTITNKVSGTWFHFGEAPKLETAENSDWNFRTGFWAIEGIEGENHRTGEKIYFALETPFVAWIARSATQLPGDYVIFQLGDDQICLLEPSTKKVALLARGQGPVVVLPREN